MIITCNRAISNHTMNREDADMLYHEILDFIGKFDVIFKFNSIDIAIVILSIKFGI